MSKNEVLAQALHLKANERFILIDELIKSLDKPDKKINDIWEDEATKRRACKTNCVNLKK